jgi:hypothetical protein
MTTYTDAAAISAYLGVTLTPEQETQANNVALAVTSFIDRYVGRSWQGTSPVTAEWLPIIARYDDGTTTTWPTVYLRQRPAIAVSAVALRSGGPAATATPLDPSQYELIDAPAGVLRLAPSGAGVDAYGQPVVALVDYTYADAVPADIALAATMMAAAEMARQLAIAGSAAFSAQHPELDGLKSIAVGQNDVNISLADSASAASAGGAAASASLAPPGSAARTILESYRRVVIA